MLKKKIIAGAMGLVGVALVAGVVFALVGDLRATVGLPGNGDCNVGIAFDGIHVMTVDGSLATGCASSSIDIYTPPAYAGGLPDPLTPATYVSTKTVKDAAGAPISVSAIDWDASRGKLWGAYAGSVYLIDIVGSGIGVSEDVVATPEFSPGLIGNGIPLIDGLAWDSNDDTLYYSPDVDCSVYQYSLGTGGNPPLGTLINTVTPKNVAGVSDCKVSGVAIGAGNTLYIGRNGDAEIRRVDKTTGAFVSAFATTAGRVEDLVCDPVTYAPLEAILAKDAYGSGGIGGGVGDEQYEAFEVETGTCPLPDRTPPEAACIETVNPHGKTVPPAGKTTLPGPKGGDNEDGFYELLAKDLLGVVSITITDAFGSGPFGPFLPGDKVKITEAPGGIPSSKPMGSANGQAGAIVAHITLLGDALMTAVDAAGNATTVSCLVPPPPK